MTNEYFSAPFGAPRFRARIVAHDRDSYLIAGEELEARAELSGRFRHENTDPDSHPVIGDYVWAANNGGTVIIDSVLPRNNLFARRAIDGGQGRQAIAANIDTLFIVMAVNRDYNLRRLERYLVAGTACNLSCAVLLNKIDLVEDPSDLLAAAQAAAGNVPVLALCALKGIGLELLLPFRGDDKTIALVGSSGAGKSTLINSLLDCPRLAAAEIRAADDRGRHTTTRRCLIALADGTSVIDTPGMREFALCDALDGLEDVFAELQEFAGACRFRDCRHDGEPGCAVAGRLSESRLQSWRKLEREAAFQARKSDRLLADAEKQRWKAIHKEARRRRR